MDPIECLKPNYAVIYEWCQLCLPRTHAEIILAVSDWDLLWDYGFNSDDFQVKMGW